MGYKTMICKFCDHLDMMHENMSEQSEDLLPMEIPHWVINPCSHTEEVGNEEVTEPQNYTELKPKFKKSYQEF